MASFNQRLTRFYSETAVHEKGNNLCPCIVKVHNYGAKQTIIKGSEHYALCINVTDKVGDFVEVLNVMLKGYEAT